MKYKDKNTLILNNKNILRSEYESSINSRNYRRKKIFQLEKIRNFVEDKDWWDSLTKQEMEYIYYSFYNSKRKPDWEKSIKFIYPGNINKKRQLKIDKIIR